MTDKKPHINLADYVDVTGERDGTAGFQQSLDDAQGRSIFLPSGSSLRIQGGELHIEIDAPEDGEQEG